MLKLTNMYLSWKGCVWEIIYGEEIYYARLAQFGTTFIFSKKQNGGACKQFFFQNYGPSSHFFSKSFAAQSSTSLHNSAQLLFFQKNKMSVRAKKSFFQNFSPNFDFFQKSFAAQFSRNLAQFSTTFVFSKKKNFGAGKKIVFFKILALIFIFFKNRLLHNSAQT